jgi:serine/threonine protein kinase
VNLEPGQVFDRYVVEEQLGRGGMAVVYKVRHSQLGSHHALKVLTISSPSIRQRLVQEGQVQATLRHPNIVAVTDLLDVNGAPGLVMEFVEGPPLDRWITSHRLSVDEAVQLFRGIVAGVQAAHAKGLVHRDLKPANVMLAPMSGQFVPKVADFGLAKALADEGEGMKRTRSGVTMGTPQYMAPEQIRDAKNVDARADVFSLGCILFELVCGRPPFEGPDLLSIFNAVASGSFPPPASLVPDLPRNVQDTILGCLKVNREERIADCAAILRVLGGAALSAEMPIPRPSGSLPAPSVAGASMDGARGQGALRGGSETYVDEDVPAAAAGGGGLQSAVSASKVSMTAQSLPAVSKSPPSDGSLAPRSASSMEPTSTSKRRGAGMIVGGLGLVAVGGGVLLIGLALAAGGGAWWWMSSTEAALADAAAQGGISFADAVVRPGSVRLTDVVVNGRDGQPVARAAALTLEGSPSDLLGGAASHATFEGLSLDLRQDASGWVLPAAGQALRIGAIETGPVDVKVTTADGTLAAKWADLKLQDATFGGSDPWAAASFAFTDLDVSATEPVLRAKEVSGASGDGVLRISGAEAWVRGRTDGFVDLPPVVAEVAPDWLGGAAPSGGRWMGVDVSALPIDPVRLDVSDSTLHLLDRANAVKAVEWSVAVDRLGLGPLSDDGQTLPVTLAGRERDARVSFDGDLRQDGMLRGTITVRGLALADLEPYLAPSLEHYAVNLTSGTVDATVDVGLKDSFVLLTLDADMRSPTFVPDPAPKHEAPKKAQKLLEPRDLVSVEREISGDLARYDFMPIHSVLKALVDELVKPAGTSVFERVVVTPKTTDRARRRSDAPAAPAPAPEVSAPGEAPPPEVVLNEPAAEPAPAEPAPEVVAEAPPAEAPPPEAPPVPAEEERDKLDRLNREVRDALNDLRLPRGGSGGR